MSDDVRRVVRPSGLSPIRRATHSGARERLQEEQREARDGRNEAAEDGRDADDSRAKASRDETPEEIVSRMDAANARLAAVGLPVQLRLGEGAGRTLSGMRIEVVVRDGEGRQVVAGSMAAEQLAGWLAGVERADGHLLDDRL